VSDRHDSHWTVLLLCRTWLLAGNDFGAALNFFSRSLYIFMADIIVITMKSALRGWQSLHKQIGTILGTGEEIFDMEGHDELMFDDELFTRSRRYFWVINCIQVSDNFIRTNIETWIEYRDKVLLPHGNSLLSEGKEQLEQGLRDGIASCDEVNRQLEMVRGLLKEQREKAMALRDGVGSHTQRFELRSNIF
jgi:hypothetical protein